MKTIDKESLLQNKVGTMICNAHGHPFLRQLTKFVLWSFESTKESFITFLLQATLGYDLHPSFGLFCIYRVKTHSIGAIGDKM